MDPQGNINPLGRMPQGLKWAMVGSHQKKKKTKADMLRQWMKKMGLQQHFLFKKSEEV